MTRDELTDHMRMVISQATDSNKNEDNAPLAIVVIIGSPHPDGFSARVLHNIASNEGAAMLMADAATGLDPESVEDDGISDPPVEKPPGEVN